MENTTVVADLFQLGKVDGKFDKELRKLYHSKQKVSRHYVEDYNVNAETSGKMYIIDKEATKQYHEDATVLRDIRKEKDATLADAAEIVINAVKKSKKRK